jgi:hypothetical protein
MAKDLAKCKQAAIAYVGIGVAIVILTTLFIPEAHYRSGFVPLLLGIVVLLVLSYLIYRGIRWLIIILTFLATARTVWWIYSFFAFADEATRWVYLSNALLNIVIIFMLARAVKGLSSAVPPLPKTD